MACSLWHVACGMSLGVDCGMSLGRAIKTKKKPVQQIIYECMVPTVVGAGGIPLPPHGGMLQAPPSAPEALQRII